MGLRVVANNMHCWSNGLSYMNYFCLENDFVFISEHWLLSDTLSTLSSFNDQFSAAVILDNKY